MSINPQFTYDNQGNALGVFLSMEDWKNIANSVDQSVIVPEWEQQMIKTGLQEYAADKDALLDWDAIKLEMDKEDESL